MQEAREMEELLRQVREANERADAAERGLQQERARAEAERDRAEAERDRADEAEKSTRPTTFDEYIAACHDQVFTQFKVETNKALTTKGGVANPQNKLCPTLLQPWSDFLDLQRSVFDTLYGCLPADTSVFESQHFLAGIGKRVALRWIADEKTLEYFLHNSIEDPTRLIMDQLKQMDEVRDAFDLGNGIVFENHPHAISDVSSEVAARGNPSTSLQNPSTPPRTPNHGQVDLNQLRPDQICIYRSGDDPSTENRTMIYVCEYKAPHKLTAPHLRAGLRPMNIHKEVVNRKKTPTSTADPDGNFECVAEKLVASALTQTYHYMIQGGLEYGLLTTGEATVFLKVDWEEPTTLYYHLAEPGPEVLAHPEHLQSSSAVGQHLAFSLMTMGSPGGRVQHAQDERDEAMANLNRWAVDFETILRSIPETERVAASASSWAPSTYEDFDRSPIARRGRGGRGRRRGRRGDAHIKFGARRYQSEPSSDEPGDGPPDTPSPSERRRGRGRGDADVPRRSRRILARRPRQGGDEEVERQFCTQACLLGLVRGGSLDPCCPNFGCHGGRAGRARAPHALSHSAWLQLLSEQMRRTLDGGITKLGKYGARGVLFKVTLLSHGYTFVCKGTVWAFIPDLEHEAAVYKRLERIQGVSVPVFLGAVDLRPLKRTYYYDHRVYIVHMTCLSWGGDAIDEAQITAHTREALEAKALVSLRAVHQEGVVHKDVRCPNMLVNKETGGVMMIDFERALLLEPARRPLAQLVPNNKRRLDPGKTTESGKGRECKRRGLARHGFAEDTYMARGAFSEMGG